jgi:hypothetical protein
MTLDERGKGRLRVLLRVSPQQCVVIQVMHLHLNAGGRQKETEYCSDWKDVPGKLIVSP